ncbi:MAG: flagellar biosynthesis anti-sigma factor FlgM [Desulfatitalea sp.]|nr:flagellar biosynthesis anti-sigma factor FlgM [Desulfatitalea sp.]
MKVNSNNPGIELNAYVKQVRQQQKTADAAQSANPPAQESGDKVNLSSRAREVQQASEMLKSMPDVRTDKVEKVKMEVDKGTYKVVGAQVATDMLKESLENNLVLQKVNTRV